MPKASLKVIAGLLLTVSVFALLSLTVSADTVRSYPIPDGERFGVNGGWGSLSDYDMDLLDAAWYADWTYRENPLQPGGAEYVQTIRLRDDADPNSDFWPPDWNAVEAAILANPGSLWLIGSEPDHMGQDNCTAAEYALRYHDCYAFIKGKDPTALVSAGGLVETTPLRLHWLNDVLTSYQTQFAETMPVDVWNIHESILTEVDAWGAQYPPGLAAYQATEGRKYYANDAVDVSIFSGLVTDFRTWMEANGYRGTPLIISELAVLQPSGCGYIASYDYDAGNQAVKDYMTGVFDFLLGTTDGTIGYPADGDHLVQRWAWYSLSAPMSSSDCSYLNSANGSLFVSKDPTYWYWDTHTWRAAPILTEFGVHYRNYVAQYAPPTIHLTKGWNLYSPPVYPFSTLTADVLASIAGSYDYVYRNDGVSPITWYIYDPSPGGTKTLTRIGPNIGVWIHMLNDDDLVVSGTPYSGWSVRLDAGWRQISYPSHHVYTVDEAFANIAGKYDMIYGYDPTDWWDPWKVYATGRDPAYNTLVSMTPGGAYWIHLTETVRWEIY